jgi:hypothetical protein
MSFDIILALFFIYKLHQIYCCVENFFLFPFCIFVQVHIVQSYQFKIHDRNRPTSKAVLQIGYLRHFVNSKFRIFRTFFFVSYTIRKFAKLYEIFLCKSIQLCGVSRNSVTCYTNFFNYLAQTTFSTHSRETSRRWLGVGEVRQYTPQPLPLHCCQ